MSVYDRDSLVARVAADGAARRGDARPAGARAWPTSSRARRPTKSKTACCGSSARSASSRPKSPRRRRRAAPASVPGDVLLAIDGQPIEGARRRARAAARVAARRSPHLHAAAARHRARSSSVVAGADAERRRRALLRARRGRHLHAARRRRGPRAAADRSGDAALLLARRSRSSALFTFSFSGRLDRVDWVFYWADAIAVLVLPPLFLHFALVFPERPHMPRLHGAARALAAGDLPARRRCSVRRASLAVLRAGVDPEYFVRVIALLDRLEYAATSRRSSPRGLAILLRALARVALGHRQAAAALDRLGHGARRRAVRARLRDAVRARRRPSMPMELSAIPLGFIPLAFASAIVRYRLMDVEVILKRLLVYTAAVAAIVAIYVADPARLGRLLRRRAKTITAGSSRSSPRSSCMLLAQAGEGRGAERRSIARSIAIATTIAARWSASRAISTATSISIAWPIAWCRACEETLVLDRMALLLGDRRRRFRVDAAVRASRARRRSCAARRASARVCTSAHTVRARRSARGRRASRRKRSSSGATPASTTSCRASSKDAAIAVLALGRRDSGEPLSSEDMALLTAVAGQAATAIENGRLYRQLHLKASELDRLRAFNENILESLDDGLLVVGLDDRVIRWNQALERLYGIAARRRRSGRPLDRAVRRARSSKLLRAARRDTPEGTPLFRVPLDARGARDGQRLLVNVTTVPLQAMAGGRDRPARSSSSRTSPSARSSKSSCASRRRWRRSACSPPAWRTRSTRRSPASRATRRCCSSRPIPADPRTHAAREDREADLPRRAHRQRAAEPVAARRRGDSPSARRSISTT